MDGGTGGHSQVVGQTGWRRRRVCWWAKGLCSPGGGSVHPLHCWWKREGDGKVRVAVLAYLS